MRTIALLRFVLLVGVVSGAPAEMKKSQLPSPMPDSTWSRVMLILSVAIGFPTYVTVVLSFAIESELAWTAKT